MYMWIQGYYHGNFGPEKVGPGTSTNQHSGSTFSGNLVLLWNLGLSLSVHAPLPLYIYTLNTLDSLPDHTILCPLHTYKGCPFTALRGCTRDRDNQIGCIYMYKCNYAQQRSEPHY